MHVATKVHVISRRFAVLTWMCDSRELLQHVALWETRSEHCNNDIKDNDDSVMHANTWFEFFGGLF
jgi:hypothetical protein